MNTSAKIATMLFVVFGVLAVIEYAPQPETVERIEGQVRYVETIRHGVKHGEQKIYVGETLTAVRTFDRGSLMSSIEYWPDGAVKNTMQIED